MMHADALRQLRPVPLGAFDDAILAIDGQFLDAAWSALRAIIPEICAATATDTGLSRLEALYDLASTGTIEDRRTRVLAAIRASGGLSKAYFIALATEMGYTITISDPVRPFRVGLSRVGVNAIRDVNPTGVADPPRWTPSIDGPFPPLLFTWAVTVTDLGSNASSTLLQTRFEALKPAYTIITWVLS